jgi:large subunit ribosomal protein L4
MKLDILNTSGEKTGRQAELNESIFGIEPNEHSVYLAVKQFLANQRQGTHKSKERSEITGSTRKLFRQKGTGNARRGDIKSPLLYGGGTIFGPRPRNYGFKLNRKVKELARRSALSAKAKSGNLMVIEDFTYEAPKTSRFVEMLSKLGLDGGRSLMVMPEVDRNVVLSARNVQKTEVIQSADLHTYGIMKAGKLVITEKALEAINKSAEN